MTRSSSPGAHSAGQPQQRQQPGNAGPQPPQGQWPQSQDPNGWPQAPAPGWPAQSHYAHTGYQQAPADPVTRGGDYHYPQPQAQQAADPYAQQRPAMPQPQYAPQFDAYVPTTRPTAPPAHAAYAAQPAPQHQAHPLQQALQAGAAQRPELRGTTQEHWPGAPAGGPHQAYQPPTYAQAPQQAESRGYDLGHYAPASAQQPAPGFDPRTYAQPQQDWHHGASQGYVQDPHAAAYATGVAQPSLDPAGYHNEQAGGYETGQELTAEQQYGQDEDYEEEEPRRRSKALIIMVALIGAIGLGGGLAYAYKTLLAPSSKGSVPVVKNDKSPTKVAPATPGGKQFANTEAKVLNSGDTNKIGGRLNDGGTPAGSSTPADDGVKRVQTLTVGRDGSIAPATNPIPGLVIADGGVGPRPAAQPQQMAAAPAPQPAAADAPRPANPEVKKIIAQPQAPTPPPAPRVAAAPPPPAVVSAKEAAAAQSVSPPARAAPARLPVAPTSAPAPSPGVGSGYVAVLASQRSQMEALQAFADLKAKYPQLLQNRQPGVQEANLGEKGVYHRLLAGPAGSKEDAAALCTQLKASGHGSCWVTAVK